VTGTPPKIYWAQWKSLASRNGVLERHRESVDGKTESAQIVITRGKVKEVMAEMYGSTSG
jgi:hypothetical protein